MASGCGDTKCGQGTVRYGDECVLHDPFDHSAPKLTIDPPLYTRQVGTVRVTADRPATIFYTIDGSEVTTSSPSGPDEIVIQNVPDNAQLRTFAIDSAGNKSDEIVRLWVIDRDGPAPPLDFKLRLAGDNSSRTVSWTLPPDLRPGGVLIARVEGRLDAVPVDGTTYTAGEKLGSNVTIVDVTGPDATGTFNESIAYGPGIVRYVAWAFDDILNYGPPAGDFAIVPFAAQTATVSVNTGTNAFTVTAAPSTLMIDGTATFNATAVPTTLTVKIALHNPTTRYLYAPKLEMTNTPATGITFTDSDGTIDTFEHKAYGAVIAPGSKRTEIWTFTGVPASSTFTMNLTYREDRVLAEAYGGGTSFNEEIVDSATGNMLLQTAAAGLAQFGNSATICGGFTPEGTMLAGQRESYEVYEFDLVGGKSLASKTFDAVKGHVPNMILDKSGTTAYVIINQLRPHAAYKAGVDGPESFLVRLDTGTLHEYGPRLPIGKSRSRSMDISSDGRTMIIATGLTDEGVIVVDLATYTIRKRIVPPFRVQAARFAPDGISVLVVGEAQLAIYGDDGGVAVMLPTPGVGGGKVTRAAFSSPDTIWVGRQDNFSSINIRTGATQQFDFDQNGSATSGKILEVFDGKVYVTGSSGQGIDVYTEQGLRDRQLTGFGYSGGPGKGSRNGYGHWVGRSPF